MAYTLKEHRMNPMVFYKTAKLMANLEGDMLRPRGMCIGVAQVVDLHSSETEYNLYSDFLTGLLGPKENRDDNTLFFGDLWGESADNGGDYSFERAYQARIIGLLFAYEVAKDILKGGK